VNPVCITGLRYTEPGKAAFVLGRYAENKGRPESQVVLCYLVPGRGDALRGLLR